MKCARFAFAATGFASVALALPASFRGVVRRASDTLSTYDYVVVGGGTSGLVVANRLSEDPDVTVLVIEAGALDDGRESVTIPAFAGNAVGSDYDWNTTYASQSEVSNRSISIPQGKVVGGSSLLNRMLLDRGSRSDYDRWEELGNPGWGFDGLLPYFKKSETFTPPTAEIVEEFGVTYDNSAHGFNGSLQNSFSPFFYPSIGTFHDIMVELGVQVPNEAAGGDAIGAIWVTHAQDPTTQTRSSARRAFYNPVAQRENLHLLTEQRVTKLVTEAGASGVAVTAVEYAGSASDTPIRVNVQKEAILAAGALHTPQILQVSGIGDDALLSSLNINTVIDLPGVGHNLQDHMRTVIVNTIDMFPQAADLQSNATFAAEARQEYDDNKTGPLTCATGDMLAFLPCSTFSNNSKSLQAAARKQQSQGNLYLPAGTDSTIVAGYCAQHKLLTRSLTSASSAPLEIIYGDGTVIPILEHPFSRGVVQATSASVFDSPSFNGRFLTNPLDLQLLVEMFKFSRRISTTNAAAAVNATEIVPGSSVATDAQIESYIAGSLDTTYHPVGTCAMLPKAKGGVVDSELKVYGTSNLRVVDASMMPMVPAAHTQSTVYAVAEKAADIIQAAA